jgi:hypothetical protein
MATADLSRRVGKVIGYPPLSELDELQRREFHEALLARSEQPLDRPCLEPVLEAPLGSGKRAKGVGR